jgi:hypothetical protein
LSENERDAICVPELKKIKFEIDVNNAKTSFVVIMQRKLLSILAIGVKKTRQPKAVTEWLRENVKC